MDAEKAGWKVDAQGFDVNNASFLGTMKVVMLKGEGGDGKDGKSAYEVAVENGYAGTEVEWLASLKGEKGDDGTNPNLIPLGARNYVLNSDTFDGWHFIENKYYGYLNTSSFSVNGNVCTISRPDGSQYDDFMSPLNESLSMACFGMPYPLLTLAVSVDVLGVVPLIGVSDGKNTHYGQRYWFRQPLGIPVSAGDRTNEWRRIYSVLETANASAYQSFVLELPSGTTTQIRRPMIEVGKIPHDWSPSPEDFQRKIEDLQNRLAALEGN